MRSFFILLLFLVGCTYEPEYDVLIINGKVVDGSGRDPIFASVGVKNDKIISIGQTSINGRPHAESNAIKNSIENLSGSKMYVTLEPCCHHGLTPPSTNIIVKEKISEEIN